VSLVAALIHVGDVGATGVPYIGEGGWGVPRASSRRSQAWSAWSWNWLLYDARSTIVERRRNATEVLADRGRPNRKRRTYLARKDAAIRRRRRERGRVDWDPHPPSTWTDRTTVR